MSIRRHRGPTSLAIVLAVLFAESVLLPGVAAETIYRCDRPDGRVIFSDSPCDDNANPYRTGNTLSVIEAPDQLAERVAQNQAFIEQRRQALSRARQTGEAASASDEKPPASVQSQSWLYTPYRWPPPMRPVRPGSPIDREPDSGSDRFSALSGPFPGTIRQPDRGDMQSNDQ